MGLAIGSLLACMFAVLIVVTLFNMREAARKKAIQQSRLTKVRQLQSQCKTNLSRLVEANATNQHGRQRLINLTSNFFVFQAISDETLVRFNTLIKELADLTEVVLAANKKWPEHAPEVFAEFIALLPVSAQQCQPSYYQAMLPKALQGVKTKLQTIQPVAANDDKEREENEPEPAHYLAYEEDEFGFRRPVRRQETA